MSTLKTYAVLVAVVLLLDLVWLGVIMKGFYAREIGELMRRNGEALEPRWGAALLVYLLIPAGLVLFVRPLISEGPAGKAFLRGALFGLVLYGVYDLTNLAVLEKWTLQVTLADMVWGCVLCGLAAVTMLAADQRWRA